MGKEVRNAFPTIGIMGGGQLGRMMALAAIRMGLGVRFLDTKASGPMLGLGETMIGDWHDAEVLRRFVEGCDVITVESEWAPAENVRRLGLDALPVWPSPTTLRLIRNKGIQKRTLAEAGLPVPAFTMCQSLEEARKAVNEYGMPCLFKRLEGSYDGYGNATIRAHEDLEPAWEKLASNEGVLVEAWAPFVRELSVLVARRPGGQSVTYPVAHTEQRDHRCHAVVVPADIDATVADRAREIGQHAVEAVGGVGITAVELFELNDGTILVNEMAPRPHNTGHYSIEGSHTSQFENHLRGILDWPLGDPSLRAPVAVMVNILGHRTGEPTMDGYLEALAIEGVGMHLYGKKGVRDKRKMGHVTVTGTDPAETRARAEEAAMRVRL